MTKRSNFSERNPFVGLLLLVAATWTLVTAPAFGQAG